ncbi:hypothetical protein K491DRAFT_690138, partial [Lophiostoma macrostomum CBS 122681]
MLPGDCPSSSSALFGSSAILAASPSFGTVVSSCRQPAVSRASVGTKRAEMLYSSHIATGRYRGWFLTVLQFQGDRAGTLKAPTRSDLSTAGIASRM